MKNIRQILALATIGVMAIGCNKTNIEPDTPPTSDKFVEVTINASTEKETKATVDYGNTDIAGGERVKWLNDDFISVYIEGQTETVVSKLKVDKLSNDNRSATFTGWVPKVPGKRMIYMFCPGFNYSNPANISFAYEALQTQIGVTANHLYFEMLMYAKVEYDIPKNGDISDMPNVTFKQLGSMLRFHIKNTSATQYKVKGIEVSESGSNKKLYDKMTIDLTATPVTYTPVGTTLAKKTLQINIAPLMAAGTGTYDCYMGIAPQGARTADDDKLIVKVLVEDEQGREFSRTVEIQCNSSFFKDGFKAGSRYHFSIALKDLDPKYKVVNVATAGTLAADENIANLKLTGKINSTDFQTMRDKMPKLAHLDLSEVVVDGNAIPNSAFNTVAGNTTLASVRLPNSVASIGEFAFGGCSSLTQITIPDGVKTIGEFAFKGCSSLTQITIPDGVKTIGAQTFNGCIKLETITLPSNLTSIGERAFQNCQSLTSINIPEKITKIESYTFQSCIKLETITLPSNLTSIGESAFYNCQSLTSIDIQATVETIGALAFANCQTISQIVVHWITADKIPEYTQDMFDSDSYAPTISVPKGTTNLYQTKWNPHNNSLTYIER